MKYRVWDNRKAEWTKDTFFLDNNTNLWYVKSTGHLQLASDKYYTVEWMVTEDAHGQEVYEGDIMKHIDGNGDDTYTVVPNIRYLIDDNLGNEFYWDCYDIKTWELAGNIHNTPELVEAH